MLWRRFRPPPNRIFKPLGSRRCRCGIGVCRFFCAMHAITVGMIAVGTASVGDGFHYSPPAVREWKSSHLFIRGNDVDADMGRHDDGHGR
jgi:hypothetical protein